MESPEGGGHITLDIGVDGGEPTSHILTPSDCVNLGKLRQDTRIHAVAVNGEQEAELSVVVESDCYTGSNARCVGSGCEATLDYRVGYIPCFR